MRYKISFSLQVPDNVKIEDVKEYVSFEVGERGSMSNDNPLAGQDLEADFMSVEVEKL
jgi:hypothetical protein